MKNEEIKKEEFLRINMKVQENRTSPILEKASFSFSSIVSYHLQLIKSLQVSIRSRYCGEDFILEMLEKLFSRVVVCKFYGQI